MWMENTCIYPSLKSKDKSGIFKIVLWIFSALRNRMFKYTTLLIRSASDLIVFPKLSTEMVWVYILRNGWGVSVWEVVDSSIILPPTGEGSPQRSSNSVCTRMNCSLNYSLITGRTTSTPMRFTKIKHNILFYFPKWHNNLLTAYIS